MDGTSKSGAVGLLALFAVFVLADSKLAMKPASSYFNICQRGDSNELDECVENNINELKPALKKGIPALGVIPLEPLTIPTIEFDDGGMFSLDTNMTNLVLRGVGDFVLSNVRVKLDEDSLVLNCTVNIPDLRIVGDYQMHGMLLMLPITGNGNFEMNITNLDTKLSFVSKVVNKNGKQYFEIVETECILTVNGVVKSWFYNLFNGQKILGQATNTFLNENYKEISDVVKHLPEGAFAKIYKDIISKVFHVYPIDELFPHKQEK